MLRCPYCGFERRERMPNDACLIACQCKKCRLNLKPKAGDSCIFCSFGTVPCPSVQAAREGG
ncbi:MAG: GDCCVxC domain-containing (seleno)protein [Acidiferrobacterales bacterium]|nr:GDCCVxC domain-containing (seleno)protein [Acidiferrobacterales bacterium]